MLYEIITQTIGFIAIAVNIVSVQFNSHAKIVFMRTLSSFLFAVQYLLLSAYTGVILEFIGWIRNFVFIYLVKKGKDTKPWIYFFSGLTLVIGVSTIILTWNKSISSIRWTDNLTVATILMVGISVLSILAKILSTIAYGIKNPHKIRLINMTTSPCWVVYNFVCFSIAGVINEIMNICSIIVAEIRYSRPNKKSASITQADNEPCFDGENTDKNHTEIG